MPRWTLTTEQRFWQKVNRDGPVSEHRPDLGPCWIWTGAHGRGYGYFHGFDGKYGSAHRFAHELLIGPIPEGLTIDHLCRVTDCVNPGHLEAVTIGVNLLRGNTLQARNAAKTHCVHGHPFDEKNTRVALARGKPTRTCRRCEADRARAKYIPLAERS